MMACVELATSERDASIPNDDGVRTLYVDKVGLKIAIGEALKASGASDLEVGATLFVTWTGEAPSSKGSPLKTWSAEYTRPTGSLGVKPAATPPAAASAGPDLLANARAAARWRAAPASCSPWPPMPGLHCAPSEQIVSRQRAYHQRGTQPLHGRRQVPACGLDAEHDQGHAIARQQGIESADARHRDAKQHD